VKNSGGTETCYGAGGGAVTSVFGRTGAVTAQTGDYTAAQVTNAVSTAPSADQTIQGSADVSFIVKQANVANTKNPFEIQLKTGTKSFYVDSNGDVHYTGSLIGDGTGTTTATFTAGAAPANPSAGQCVEYVDSTSGTWKFLNSSGGNCLDIPLHNHSSSTTGGQLDATAVASASKQGNGTKFAMATGTFTSGDYVKIDSNGNLVDGGAGTGSGTVASGTAAMGTSAISSGTCSSVVSVSATGVATTDSIIATPNTDPTTVTGYGPSASGSLFIVAYPTANYVNFKVCNNTANSITPGALTLNWRVTR